MSIEPVFGVNANPSITNQLLDALNKTDVNGTLYIGYPIIASATATHAVEALLVSDNKGLVAFHFPSSGETIDSIKNTQDQIFYLLEGNLKKYEELRNGRTLGVVPNVMAFFPDEISIPASEQTDTFLFSSASSMQDALNRCQSVPDKFYTLLCAAIQRVTSMKPTKKRENVCRDNSKGATIKSIEKEIANLDAWQKRAAIEVPEGPQRIRGLAGSGKTVVLALKAAYLHARHPEWTIVVTFHSRSLRQQFCDLISRFYFEQSGDIPNWEKLCIYHAWGTNFETGVYSEIASSLQALPINYANAKQKYGVGKEFWGICNDLLAYSSQIRPLYDAVLIDEAQDLPVPFFKLIYLATQEPKRIYWAYDELQNLSDASMASVEDMFGKDDEGNALVTVCNIPNEPKKDIVLPVCYRNTPWTLTIAHALGFGIYREQGLVQLFDELNLWTEIGYSCEEGTLEFGKRVSLLRRLDSYPSFFNTLLTQQDTFACKSFSHEVEQFEWIANEIHKNINNDELRADDILIILPDAYTSREKYHKLSEMLGRVGVNSHLAGVSTNRDTFYSPNSVTVSSIYRAKGNEAPMVYIANSDFCAVGQEMIKLRNILFTAITRSRAWTRLCGIGANMEILIKEVNSVVKNGYKLIFEIPSVEKLNDIRLIHRDRTKEEQRKITSVQKSIRELKELIDEGIINIETLPELQEIIRSLK